MILPVFYTWAGRLLCLAAMLFGWVVAQRLASEKSHSWVGIFFVASGLFSVAGSLYLSRWKRIRNHVMFIPVWAWGTLASLLGAYCLYEAYTFRLT